MAPVIRTHRRVGALLVASVLLAATTAACSSGSSDGSRSSNPAGKGTTTTTSGPKGDGPIELLPLSTSKDRRIVDADGRDVLLRGANVNSLGEYWQGVPSIDPTLPVSDDDWDTMAAHGFSVIRLLVSWSRIEPLGFDAEFRRLWEYYLAYCEAAFETGQTDVVQFTLEHAR